MKTIPLIILLMASVTFAQSKYKTVVIDEKKIEAQRPKENLSQKYEASAKGLLKHDFKSADVHLVNEGSLKWLFVVITHEEWMALNKDSRRELVGRLIRHMKTNFKESGLKLSIGISADQPLAEADWGQLSNGPSIELIGE